MAAIDSFNFYLPTRIVFGCGTVERIGTLSRSLGKRALIVTGRQSTKKSGLLERVMDLLRRSGITSVVFDDIVPNPLSTSID